MIGIIDYNMGNIQSVVNAFEYIGAPVCVVRAFKELADVDKIVLPGVGAFGRGMENLGRQDLVNPLSEQVLERKKPFLGICLGLQLICKESFEFGHFQGLNWINASVRRLKDMPGLNIPHIGWNNLIVKKKSVLLDVGDNPDVYFVHSYCVDALGADFIIATCEYGQEFVAVIEKENIFATQFHPEKSQRVGLNILRRFVAY